MLLKPSFLKLLSGRSCGRSFVLIVAGLIGCTLGLSPHGLTDSRSTFPGRRVGGGTRGECTARILAHLVPANSVFGLSSAGDIAMVHGPTANPVSLTISLKPEAGGDGFSRSLPAAPAGITLIRVEPIRVPMVWESGFDCSSGSDAAADPLSFVTTAAPPAVSLLLPNQEPADVDVQQALQALRQSCGSTVPTAATLSRFGLADLVTSQWPSQLPVRCPS